MEGTNSNDWKKLRLLVAALVFSFGLNAQWAFQATYVNSKIGTGGINILATKTMNRHQLGVGLRINIYSLAHKDNQNNIYTKRFYPTTFAQNFGFAGYYEFSLFPQITPSRISMFTDVQLTYGPTRNEMFSMNLNQSGVPVYEFKQERFGPFLWIENTIGLSFNLPIYRNWSLVNKFGIGLMSIIGDKLYASENTAILFRPFYDWELSYTVQLGLSYTFNK